MVSYSPGSSSESYSASEFPLGTGETKRTSRQLMAAVKPAVFGGDFNSPISKAVYNLAKGDLFSMVAELTKMIEGKTGMSQPAVQKSVGDLSTKALTAAAGTSTAVWKEMLATVKELLKSAGQRSSSTSSQGAGGGITYSGQGLGKEE